MDKFPAKLDDFELDCESLDDGIEKAIARYEYPYRDGADTDDLGQKAHTLRLRCYFLNERYAEHIQLLDHLKQRELFELSHPKYGLMNVRVESISIRHDDREECAEIDLAFIQDLASQEAHSVAFLDLLFAVEVNVAAAIAAQQAAVAAHMASLGPEYRRLAEVKIDPKLPIMQQLSGLSAAARSYMRAVDSAVATFEGTLSTVTQPLDTLISTIAFTESIPGRVIGSVTRAVERVVTAATSLRDFPKRFLSNLDVEILRLQTEINNLAAIGGIPRVSNPDRSANQMTARTVGMAGAVALSLAAAEIFVDEQTRRDSDRRVEGTGSGSASGSLMSVRDLELCLATVRTAIQRTLDDDRNQPQLRSMALDLLSHVNTTKLERELVYIVEIEHPLPLQLLCHQHGLSYRAASRVLALNPDLSETNFITGEVDLYRSAL